MRSNLLALHMFTVDLYISRGVSGGSLNANKDKSTEKSNKRERGRPDGQHAARLTEDNRSLKEIRESQHILGLIRR